MPESIAGALIPHGLSCEGFALPVGIHSPCPRLSWQVPASRRGARQIAYRLLAASTPELLIEGHADLWDSGRVESGRSVAVPYAGKALTSRQRVFWSVRIWDERGQAAPYSAPGWWEMGLLCPEDWQAQWIAAPTEHTGDASPRPAPLFRTDFVLHTPLRDARLYVCGLGYHELYLNGARVGDQVLAPSFTRYDMRALYLAHDITNMLQPGVNALAVMLGTGWYNCHTADVWNFAQAPWRDRPKLLLQLHVTLADGTVRVICSDGQWKVNEGPLRFDGLRNGETYDARLELPGWNTVEYDDSGWQPAMVVPGPGGMLEAELLPCRVMAEITPIAVTEVRTGSFVVDLGQNISGWARLRVCGPAGTEVTLRYAEKLTDDGEIDQSNINVFIHSGDCQTDRYILKGDGLETWEPRFTYHGFRYVQLDGFPGTPDVDALRGCVVHTSFQSIGDFRCDNALINNLHQCARWSYISNFVGIPTDCPHREKNGWTGDALIATEMGLFNYAAAPAYRKWLRDFVDAQRPNGQLPGIVPTGGWGYNWGSGPAWDSAYVQIPWLLYCYSGDESVLVEHYPGMKRYLDFMHSMADDHILSFGLGDWCPPGSEGGGGHVSPTALTSTAYYYANNSIMAKVARLLCRAEDAHAFAALSAQIRGAFNRAFYDAASGNYAGGDQTSLACALYWGLADEGESPKVLARLIEAVEATDFHPTFGILGAKYVLNALVQHDRADVAYRLLTQTSYPSWGQWLDQGATTLWEMWEGGTSRNHIMFGDISAWMYKALAGIAPDEATPGFRHSTIYPRLIEGLSWASGVYHTPYGRLSSSWQREKREVQMHIEIPGNSGATVILPGRDACAILEGGRPLHEADGLTLLDHDSGKIAVLAQAGDYRFKIAVE